MTNPNQLCEVLLFVCSKMANETSLSSKLLVADRKREVWGRKLSWWCLSSGFLLSYDAAKCNDRHAVHHAPQEADKNVYKNTDPKSLEVYHLANKIRWENADVVGDKPVKNDAGEMFVWRLKAEGLVRALPKASQRLIWLGPRPPFVVYWICPSHAVLIQMNKEI